MPAVLHVTQDNQHQSQQQPRSQLQTEDSDAYQARAERQAERMQHELDT